jgi:hypothetical protein
MRDLVKIANQLVFQNDALALAAIARLVTKTTARRGDVGRHGDRQPVPRRAARRTPRSRRRTRATRPTRSRRPRRSSPTRSVAPSVPELAAPRAGGQRDHRDINAIDRRQDVAEDHEHAGGVSAIVLDSTMLGSMAFERLGGGYQGDPSDMTSGVESSGTARRTSTASWSRPASCARRWSRSRTRLAS